MDDNTLKNIITECVCEFNGVSLSQIRQETRARNIVIARQYLHYFLRKYTKLNLQAIADFTERSHADVLHSVKTINDSVYINKYIAAQHLLLTELVINKIQ